MFEISEWQVQTISYQGYTGEKTAGFEKRVGLIFPWGHPSLWWLLADTLDCAICPVPVPLESLLCSTSIKYYTTNKPDVAVCTPVVPATGENEARESLESLSSRSAYTAQRELPSSCCHGWLWQWHDATSYSNPVTDSYVPYVSAHKWVVNVAAWKQFLRN